MIGFDTDTDIDLSVVIPVYRSEASLPALVARLLPALEGTRLRHEVVFVEDGSPDGSWRVLERLQAEHPGRLVAIQLMRNYGQHNALMCGFRHTRGRFVVTMDDDLQNPPEEIPKLLAAIREGDLDLVYGRVGEKKHAGWRNAGSALVNAFYRYTFKATVTVTSFRIIRRELLDSIFPYDLNFTFVDGLLAWNTRRVGEVAVEHHPRAEGRSGYNLGRLMALALNLLTNFSIAPLQVVSAFGIAASGGGFLLAAYYLVQYFLANIQVPGYASIIVTVLITGGLQLLSIGVLGEYIGRMHLNLNHKPQYVVRRAIGRSQPREPSVEVVADGTE
jgi:polyisoprenyl-phosphate glycosyltransferase